MGPQWSADGQRIAFTTERDNTADNLDEIYTMNADGSDQQRLTFTSTSAFEGSPSWSPDGTKIVFERGRPFQPERDLYVINADGSGEVRLTQDGDEPPAGVVT